MVVVVGRPRGVAPAVDEDERAGDRLRSRPAERSLHLRAPASSSRRRSEGQLPVGWGRRLWRMGLG